MYCSLCNEKVLAHTRVCPNCGAEFEKKYVKKRVRNAYGALVDGAAASEGYALALSALCGELGIETRRVNGRWNGAEHSWNLVELDGKWYHVDASLCDRYANESYLFRTDEEVAGELKWSPQGLPQTAEEPYSWENEPVFSDGGADTENNG